MSTKDGTRTLGILAITSSILLVVYVLLFATGLLSPSTANDEYEPKERVLNCFPRNELNGPLAVSPAKNELIRTGFRKLMWVTNCSDRDRAMAVAQDFDFGEHIVATAFSGDGQRVAFYATSPEHDTLAVFDVPTRRVLNKWPAARSIYTPHLRLSYDGSILAMNSVEWMGNMERYEAVALWDTSTGQLVGSVMTPKDLYLTDFIIRPGRVILAYLQLPDYREIQTFETVAPYDRNTPVCSIKAHGRAAFCDARFSSDGSRLGVAYQHAQPMRVYAVANGGLIVELKEAYRSVTCGGFPGFALSAKGNYLAVANSGGTATLWSVDSAKKLGTFIGCRYDGPHDLVFGPANSTLISSFHRALIVWDIRDLTFEIDDR